MGRSHVQLAAGVCVLAVAVAIGTPAIAAGEPEAGGAAAASGEKTKNDFRRMAKPPTDRRVGTVDAQRTIRRPVSRIGAARSPGNQAPTTMATQNDSTAPSSEAGAVTSNSAQVSSDPAPATGTAEASAPTVAPDPPTITVTVPTASAAPPAPVSEAPTGSDGGDGATAAAAPASADVAPPPAQPPPATGASPTPDAVPLAAEATPPAPVAVTGVETPVPVAPVPPPVPPPLRAMMPISIVLGTVQYLVTGLVVAPLVHLACDIASLFAATGVVPVVTGVGRVDALATGGWALLGVGIPGATATVGSEHAKAVAEAIRLTPLGAITASAMDATRSVATVPLSAVDSMGSPTSDDSVRDHVESFVRDIGRELLHSPSLMALAVMALPGFGGLLIITAAGVQIGYRQARCCFAMQAQGIARFAKTGPLGVVRSDSLVFVRPRPTHKRVHAVNFRLDEVA